MRATKYHRFQLPGRPCRSAWLAGSRGTAVLRAAGISLLLLSLVSSAADRADKADRAKTPKRPPRPRPCLDLPEDILEQMFGRLSAGVLSAFHHALQLAPLEKENITCPASGRPAPDTKSRLPVNLLSISPWAYRISHDPTRYPRYIPEAYCLCQGCLSGPRGQESMLYRSTPVYMPAVVLRRAPSCTGGRYAYAESYVSLAVGCTCIPQLDRPSNDTWSRPA